MVLSLDTTEEESRNQFLEEIELMKAIGSHRNIVRMLGCCVNSDPIFLVLEYMPYGDLLHWLRNKRIQVNLISRKQGWRSGESACLQKMWPGLDSGSSLFLVLAFVRVLRFNSLPKKKIWSNSNLNRIKDPLKTN